MNKVTLREWILFLTLFPTTAVGLTLAVFFSLARLEDLENDIQNRTRIIAASIAQNTGPAVDNNNFVGITRLANLLHRDNSDFVDSIMVFDPRNKVLVNTSERFSASRYQLPVSEIRTQGQELIPAENGFKMIYPIEIQVPPRANLPAFERFYGYVLILINKEQMRVNQQNMVFLSLIMVMVAMIICSLFAKRMINLLSNPIAQMNDTVLKIREGILSARVEKEFEGEIEVLRVGLNNMAQAIEDYQLDLEENIDQATLDLRESLERFEAQNVELDLSRRKAQEASRVKSEFLANMSHELRTPLNGVIGFTKQILKTPLTDNQREFLQTIEGSANSLLTIINDILDFSKLDSGRMVIESIPFNLRATIDEVVILLAQQAHQKNLQFSVRVDHRIPNSLIGDAMRIKQVIINLLGNAIKFTDKGSICMDFDFERVEESKIKISCSVIDTGIGISERSQETLFEAFGQADKSITRLYGGTGLGLIIAKRLANEMQGDVGFTSQPNRGSTFWFSFICEENQLPIDNIPEPEDLAGHSILYYEPHAHARTATNELLRHWRMQVKTVNSLSELDQQHDLESFDIALLGMEVTATNIDDIKNEIKRLSQHIPQVHIAINNNSLSLKETFLAAGAASCISKPLTESNLARNLSMNKHLFREGVAKEEPSKKLPIKVLAVDDNDANLKLIHTLLSEHVEKVVTAANGKDALHLCIKETFALIFMDIQMPIMDGISSMEAIRDNTLNSETDIIAVTAHAMPGEKEKLLERGFQGYMTKPIDETLLTHLLYEHCGIEQISSRDDIKYDSFNQFTSKSVKNGVFDWPLALKRSGNRPNLAAEMLVMLVDSLPEMKESIIHSVKQNDLPSVSNTIHKLHGACCYNGVPKLEKICQQLESQIKLDKQLHELEPELFELFDEIDKVLEKSQAYFKELHIDSLINKNPD
ncbi:two-component sensor histidine kinase BarA [Thalassotalea aquiviva]|uniref:two-component sensor histidine kinase BarA n=1 Tax=Thalassotalea aquiviva TaxID=3242415 RepID=UPI00352BCF21